MTEESQTRDFNGSLYNGETVEPSAASLSKNGIKNILETEDLLDESSGLSQTLL